LLVEHGAYCLAWIGRTAPDNPEHLEPVAYGSATAETTDWRATEPELALARTAVQSGEIAIIQNIPADPERADWHEPAAAAGISAAAALPLPVLEETHSVLVVYAAAPDAFDASEQMLLQHVAHVLATALQV
jgi:GAF domain-containing protein